MDQSYEKAATLPLLKRLLVNYFSPYKKRFFMAIICMVIVSACTALTAWMIQPIIDLIFVERMKSMLYVLPLGIIFIFFIKGIAGYFQNYLMEYIGQAIIADVQSQVYKHVIKSDIALFHRETTSRLTTRFIFDISQLKTASSNVIIAGLRDFTTIVGLMSVMIYHNWLMALMAFTVIPLAAFPIISFGKRIRKYALGTQEEMGGFMNILNESMGHIRQVKTYTMEDYEVTRSDSAIQRIFKLLMKSARVRALSSPVMEMLAGVIIAIIMFYGGLQVWHGSLTTGAFLSFLTAAMTIYRPLKSVTSINNQLQVAAAAAARTFALLDEHPTVEKDAEDAKKLTITEGVIDFKNVCFTYADGSVALNDVSFNVQKGQTAAFVGSSGAGKTSVLNLIPRFYTVDSGVISIDAQSTEKVSLQSLRQNIALVTQDVALFDDTIANNIAYGRPEASLDDIKAAAEKANAHAFIEEQPDGYDTRVGESGLKLSGGQKQRIAIARAILKDAPILLLDEATSALDTESEKHVQEALDKLMEGRTTIVVAHRLSTIQNADIIYVMDKGQIIEQGSHDDLMKEKGRYHTLYTLQQK